MFKLRAELRGFFKISLVYSQTGVEKVSQPACKRLYNSIDQDFYGPGERFEVNKTHRGHETVGNHQTNIVLPEDQNPEQVGRFALVSGYVSHATDIPNTPNTVSARVSACLLTQRRPLPLSLSAILKLYSLPGTISHSSAASLASFRP